MCYKPPEPCPSKKEFAGQGSLQQSLNPSCTDMTRPWGRGADWGKEAFGRGRLGAHHSVACRDHFPQHWSRRPVESHTGRIEFSGPPRLHSVT